MIRAFAATLEDDNLLVRRGALDILLQAMRMDSAAIKSAQPEDRAILMTAATSVVLRRDLSLNRRLYTWLLGPDDKSEAQTAYLNQHGLQLLSSTLKVIVCSFFLAVFSSFCLARNVFPFRGVLGIPAIQDFHFTA